MRSSDDQVDGIHALAAAAIEDKKQDRELARSPEASQIRAARALIGWNQTELATASGVAVISVKNIERGATRPSQKTLIALRRALANAGVILLGPDDMRPGGHGVRLSDVNEAT